MENPENSQEKPQEEDFSSSREGTAALEDSQKESRTEKKKPTKKQKRQQKAQKLARRRESRKDAQAHSSEMDVEKKAVETDVQIELEEKPSFRKKFFSVPWGTIFSLLLVVFFLGWYCMHPSYWEEEEKGFLLNIRTCFVLVSGVFLLMLCLLKNRLSERLNFILSWVLFFLTPLAVYFSLYHMNATKFKIVFTALNPYAVAFTFWFLFLALLILVLVTGSIRISGGILAIAICLLGIANWYVIKFRGMALSGADLFSLGTAADVAANYTYEIDWFVFSEAYCTLGICLILSKLKKSRAFPLRVRGLLLIIWLIASYSFFYICCRTSFLEDHDIRSKGFTHQLRYKQYDMLFTTLCTCFYLSVEKPEGYSTAKVEELAEEIRSDTYFVMDNAGEEDKTDSPEAADQEKAADAEDAEKAADVENAEKAADAEDAEKAADDGNAEKAVNVENAAGEEEKEEVSPAQVIAKTIRSSAEGIGQDLSNNEILNGTVLSSDQEDTAEGDTITPDAVIVIMNESFADYSDIGVGLDTSEDCMPFFHSLTENTIRGTAYSSVFGGNTANSEFEFLTGNTMAFLPESSVAYNFYVQSEMPSVAWELREAGYNAIAVHPYRGTNYRRSTVYPYLGFEKFYTRTSFYDPDIIRRYISDDALADKIISLFNLNAVQDKDTFLFNVSMQNHSDYLASNITNLPLTISVLNSEVDHNRTTIYSNLIKQSDEMLKKLVEYFSEREENVVIVMFGDHQANLGDDTYEYLLGKTEEELTAEERMEKYKVPFLIWANYDIEEETIEATSLNYLYSILADRLQLPMTDYQTYLLELSEQIPVIASGGYWGDDGNFYEISDEESPYYQLINDYNILEYNYLFGKKNRSEELFTLQTEIQIPLADAENE